MNLRDLTIFFAFNLLTITLIAQTDESWNFENFNGKAEQSCKKFKPKNNESLWMHKTYSDALIFDLSGKFDGCQLQDGKFYYYSNIGPNKYDRSFYMIGDLSNGKFVSGEITIYEGRYGVTGKYVFKRLTKNDVLIDKIEIKGAYQGLEVTGTAYVSFSNKIPNDIYYDSLHWVCPDGTSKDSLIKGRNSSEPLGLGSIKYTNGTIFIGAVDIPVQNANGKGIMYYKNGKVIEGDFEKNKIKPIKKTKIIYPDKSFVVFEPRENEYVETDLILADGSKRKQVYLMDSLVAEEGTHAWELMLAEKKKKAEEERLAKKLKREKDSIAYELRKNDPVYQSPDIHCFTFILKKTTGTVNVSVRYSAIYIQIEDYTKSASESTLMSKAKEVMRRDINLNGYTIEREFLDQAECSEAKQVVEDSGLEISDFRVLYGTIE